MIGVVRQGFGVHRVGLAGAHVRARGSGRACRV